jgi:hypothetical protein
LFVDKYRSVSAICYASVTSELQALSYERSPWKQQTGSKIVRLPFQATKTIKIIILAYLKIV